MKLVLISDTHGAHGLLSPGSGSGLELPEGRVLCHAGDFTASGSVRETVDFLRWFAEVGEFEHRILVAGNHDWLTERAPGVFRSLLPGNVTYLEGSGTVVEGLRFWGSPWQPIFGDWAWNRPPELLERHWKAIPEGTDVLITHTPPLGMLDLTRGGGRAGDPALRRATAAVRPALHLFGHIHEGYGVLHDAEMGRHWVNAAVLNRDYVPVNPPVSVTL